jgi:hypothetical protein
MTKKRKASSVRRTQTKRKKQTLESFPTLSHDIVLNVTKYLDLLSIISLKSSCKEYYTLMENDPMLWKRMFTLALKTPTPPVLVEPHEREQIVKQLLKSTDMLSTSAFEQVHSVIEAKLAKLRTAAALTAKQQQEYQSLLEELVDEYLGSDLELITPSFFDSYLLSAVEYFQEGMSRSGYFGRGGFFPVKDIMDYILENDLTLDLKDLYIKQLIDERIGNVDTRM